MQITRTITSYEMVSYGVIDSTVKVLATRKSYIKPLERDKKLFLSETKGKFLEVVESQVKMSWNLEDIISLGEEVNEDTPEE